MPVRRTPFLAGHFYHIYNRGVNAGRVFFGLDNYKYFLSLVAKKLSRHRIRIVAYFLMPNHFHLLLRPDLDETVAAFMNSLCGAYARALNRQRGRRGPLFQGRYRSIEVEAEAYLIHLARYIHLNPVVARLVPNFINIMTYSDWLSEPIWGILSPSQGEGHASYQPILHPALC